MAQALALLLSVVLSASAADWDALFDGRPGGTASEPVAADAKPGDSTSTPAPPPPVEPTPIPGSDWAESPAGPDGFGDGLSDANPSAAEKLNFRDGLNSRTQRDSTLDSICRQAGLPVSEGLQRSILDIGGAFDRRLRVLPAGGLALVDSVELDLGLGSAARLLDLDAGAVAVTFGARLSGVSTIIRPLLTNDPCHELLTWLDLRKVKTVLPLSAGRFRDMRVGEIWKMPVKLTARVGAGLSVPTAIGLTPSVSFGYSRQGGVNLTLRRLGEDKLRVRLRLDKADVLDGSGGVAWGIPAGEFAQWSRKGDQAIERQLKGLPAGKLIARALESAVIPPLARYLTSSLGFVGSWVVGDQALLEFVLDPRDETQMNDLERLVALGDVSVLKNLARASVDLRRVFLGTDERLTDVDALRAYSAKLGPEPTFSGTDSYEKRSRGFTFRVPLLLSLGFTKEKDRDVFTFDDESRLEVRRSNHQRSRGTGELPFVGTRHRHDASRTMMAGQFFDPEGRPLPPHAIYVYQQGYLRQDTDVVRSDLKLADSILAYVGAQGRGTNPRTALPIERLAGSSSVRVKHGTVAFTLVLGDAAVQRIARTASEDIVRAYANGRQDADIRKGMLWVLDRGHYRDEGWLRYLDAELQAAVPGLRQEDLRNVRIELDAARALAREVRRFAGTGSSEDLLRVLTATRYGRLDEENILRTLVQFARPEEVSAELMVAGAPAAPGAPSKPRRLVLNPAGLKTAAIEKTGRTLSRFAQPSELAD